MILSSTYAFTYNFYILSKAINKTAQSFLMRLTVERKGVAVPTTHVAMLILQYIDMHRYQSGKHILYPAPAPAWRRPSPT